MAPQVIRVYSENNDFQHAEVLKRNRIKRQRHREFFVEGVRSINQAIAHRWQVRTLVYSTERRLSQWARATIENAQADKHLELPLELMRKLSEKKKPSELIALVSMPENDLARIRLGPELLVVVFDRPSNHGNLGTLIRSCDALRADGLVITGHAVDLYDPQTIRASTGSFFSLPVVRLPSPKDLVPWFAAIEREIGPTQVIGTSAKAERDILDVDFAGPTALIIGNEAVGLSRSYRTLCDSVIRVPIYGSATSLNVACAASIVLYEIDRQRRTRHQAGPATDENVHRA